LIEKLKIPIPLPKPKDLEKDLFGRSIGEYTPAEYKLWKERQERLALLKVDSKRFKERARKDRESASKEGGGAAQKIEEEKARRREIGRLTGKGTFFAVHGLDECQYGSLAMGRYESDPVWDDVVPIPQDDGEGALAQIAYTDEYAEGTPYPGWLQSFTVKVGRRTRPFFQPWKIHLLKYL
jgi:protein farnesyltransferase/geranylgeranyltransferase type-1 subunit alpha